MDNMPICSPDSPLFPLFIEEMEKEIEENEEEPNNEDRIVKVNKK